MDNLLTDALAAMADAAEASYGKEVGDQYRKVAEWNRPAEAPLPLPEFSIAQLAAIRSAITETIRSLPWDFSDVSEADMRTLCDLVQGRLLGPMARSDVVRMTAICAKCGKSYSGQFDECPHCQSDNLRSRPPEPGRGWEPCE